MLKLILVILTTNLYGNWTPSKEVPFELESLIQSASKNNEDYQEKLKVSLGKVFHFYNSLDKKDFYYLFKVSTYKYLLREKPETRIPVNYYDSPYLNQFIRNKAPANLDKFSNWLWSSFVRDIDIITRNPSYFRLVEARRKNQLSNAHKILDKKIRLVLPWLIFLKTTDPAELKLIMQDIYISILEQSAINMKMFKILKENKNIKLPGSFDLANYINFNDKKDSEKKTADSEVETINKIVKEVTKESLPRPTDDWILESGEYLPEDDQNLPNPVDDWLNEF